MIRTKSKKLFKMIYDIMPDVGTILFSIRDRSIKDIYIHLCLDYKYVAIIIELEKTSIFIPVPFELLSNDAVDYIYKLRNRRIKQCQRNTLKGNGTSQDL